MIKDEKEIECLRKSAALLWKGFQYIKMRLHPGAREKQIASEFETFTKERGAKAMAFEPIIAFGKNSAEPHHRAGKDKLQENDIAMIDIGVIVEKYCSDMTRVLFFGEANPRLKKMYEIVKKSQRAALALCKPGTIIEDLNQAARKVLRDAGMEEYFIHGLGHGVGLEIHEAPHFRIDKDLALKANMVITIEPGLYIPDLGGVRYEDTIIITETGYESLYPEDEG